MSDTSEEYNNFPNYQTWCVATRINDDKQLHAYWLGEAQIVWDIIPAGRSRDDKAAAILSSTLQTEIEGEKPEIGPSMYGDMLDRALSRVDWERVAWDLVQEVDKFSEKGAI